MRDIKLPRLRFELARRQTTTHKFVCFDVTSRVDIDYARSSLCQARWLSRDSIGTEVQGFRVGVPRETDFISRIQKLQSNIEYHIHHLIPHHILFTSMKMVSEAADEGKMSKLRYTVRGQKYMRDIKLPRLGLKLDRLLTTRHNFACFDITSRVDSDFARSSLSEARYKHGQNILEQFQFSFEIAHYG